MMSHHNNVPTDGVNYGSNGNFGLCFWLGGFRASRATDKDIKRKKNLLDEHFKGDE